MSLRRINIQNLRNVVEATLFPSPHINIIYGKNGSGKTSILEAINVLGLGRSFRSYRPKPIINYSADKVLLFSELVSPQSSTPIRLGVEKTRQGQTSIRVDGETLLSAAKLAEYLPILTINPDSFELINGPPKPRRQFLDWLSFHVEPRFLPAWRKLQECLKQRNNLLRHDRIEVFQLRSWDAQLIGFAEEIDSIRTASFSHFLEAFEQYRESLDLDNVSISYRRGWKDGLSYREALEKNRELDIQRGYTATGPHRADIDIKTQSHNVADVLSRGQQKSLVTAMLVAQSKAFKRVTGRQAVFLVDDLPSELDSQHQSMLGAWLTELGDQVFVTGVERGPLKAMWPENIREEVTTFHVELGEVRQE